MEVENEKQAELWVCENCGRNSEYYKDITAYENPTKSKEIG